MRRMRLAALLSVFAVPYTAQANAGFKAPERATHEMRTKAHEARAMRPIEARREHLKTVLDVEKLDPRVEDFEKALKSKVIGQDKAIHELSDLYQTILIGTNEPGRPLGNYLFLGPTGTGKTRTVEAAAEVLFGDKHAIIKIDCAEFQHSHEVAKLIGSPPGYLGHRETPPLLTQEALNQYEVKDKNLKDKKVSLVLFDEVEKASDSVWKLLLGIMDKASLTLGDNRKVDFSNTIVLMTSNVGVKELSDLVAKKRIGFGMEAPQVAQDKMTKQQFLLAAAKSKFDPEFLNRLDKQVVFDNLDRDHLSQILDLELDGIAQRFSLAFQSTGDNGQVKAGDVKVKLTPEARDYLLDHGVSEEYGARYLKRTLRNDVQKKVERAIATKQIKSGDTVTVDVNEAGDGLAFLK